MTNQSKPVRYAVQATSGSYLVSINCHERLDSCKLVWDYDATKAKKMVNSQLALVLKQLAKHQPNCYYRTFNLTTGEVHMTNEPTKAKPIREYTITDKSTSKHLTGWVYDPRFEAPLTSWRDNSTLAAKMSEQEAQNLIDDMTNSDNTDFEINEYFTTAVVMTPHGTEPVRVLGEVMYLVLTDDRNYIKAVDWNSDQTLKSVNAILAVTDTEEYATLYNKADADLLLNSQPYVLGYYEARIPF